MRPQRIQRKRSMGWKMPENTVYVGRPTIWGNPYPAGEYTHTCFITKEKTVLFRDAADAVEEFRNYIEAMVHCYADPRFRLEELRGKNLACWCPLDQPCHADVLLELANAPR